MIELLMNPKRAERQPWEMFFIGLFYASVSLLLVSFVFLKDSVLSQYSGILVVTFSVICTLPFMYYIIKYEEKKDVEISDEGKLIKEHSKALKSLMWLFLGFVVALAFWYIILVPGGNVKSSGAMLFNAQIEVYCAINNPANFNYCIESQGLAPITGNITTSKLIMSIFANNIYVLIFTLLFSLAFGAGAIFILVWNASVIASAIGIFAKSELIGLPCGLIRYMIHGIPEILAYFLAALAGGIISIAIIRKDMRGEKMWKILQDALILIIIAIVILLLATLVEVFLTPDIVKIIGCR